MARKAPKMTNLLIEETSGVDHPAHLHEGWLVVKAANTSTVEDVIRSLPEPLEANMSETTETVELERAADETPEVEELKQEEGDMMGGDALAMAEAKIAELEARIAELEAMTEEPEMEVEVEAGDMMEESVKALAKNAPEEVRKALVDMAKAKAEAEATLAKEREERADADSIVKARETFKHLSLDAEKIGPALRRLGLIDADLAKSIEDVLVAVDAQSESADIFAEIGKASVPSGDAYHQMTSLAKAAVAEGKAATIEQAMAQVAVSNPALYNDYLNEKGA